MTGPVPSLFVTGRAQRRVVPDRVVVAVDVETTVHALPQDALADGAAARRRLLDHLRAAHPDAEIGDARITTRPEQIHSEVEVGGGRREQRWEVVGHRGVCSITVEGPAGEAAALVATAGAHPDASRVMPLFRIGPELARRVGAALEEDAIRDALARAEGLAAAAGMSVGGVLSIGERPTRMDEEIGLAPLAAAMSATGARDLVDSLGELRPEPETLAAAVPVRLALVPRG